jgi:hypothetical protein
MKAFVGFPEDKELKQVVCHHQHQHREGEECDIAEKPCVPGISVHVADGIDMDQ